MGLVKEMEGMDVSCRKNIEVGAAGWSATDEEWLRGDPMAT